MHFIFEPGFFSSQPVRSALELGAIVAVVSAIVGIFTIIRSQAFAGHALTDVATAGGAGATYVNVNSLVGFIGGAMIGAGTLETIGIPRARQRDLLTGIVLGTSTGLSALFLYLNTTTNATSGTAQRVLFGSIFTVSSSTIPMVLLIGSLVLFITFVIWRPLMLSSISPEIASASGVRIRVIGMSFVLLMATAVGISSIAVGSILSTALLIGPTAIAFRTTKNIQIAIFLSCTIGIFSTWLGILLAYDSYYWSSTSKGFPVSFFIVTIVFILYLFTVTSNLSRRKRSITCS